MKNLIAGTALYLVASSASAEWLFRVEYTQTNMKKATGIYSCVGHIENISICTKTSGIGPEAIFMNFGNGQIHKKEINSNDIDYRFRYEKDKAILIEPLGKKDLAKFINETSP